MTQTASINQCGRSCHRNIARKLRFISFTRISSVAADNKSMTMYTQPQHGALCLGRQLHRVTSVGDEQRRSLWQSQQPLLDKKTCVRQRQRVSSANNGLCESRELPFAEWSWQVMWNGIESTTCSRRFKMEETVSTTHARPPLFQLKHNFAIRQRIKVALLLLLFNRESPERHCNLFLVTCGAPQSRSFVREAVHNNIKANWMKNFPSSIA